MEVSDYLEAIRQALETSVSSRSAVVVIFIASWNKECNQLLKDVTTHFPTSESYQIINVKIDECEESEDVFNITTIPCVRIYSNGQLHDNLEGCQVSVTAIKRALEKIAALKPAASPVSHTLGSEEILKLVSSSYAATATGSGSCCVSVDPSLNGYSVAELVAAGSANLGLGCGNPLSFAQLQKGEVVVDLGCGAGIDCLLAADQVGHGGQVIGVDMTPEMIHRARENVITRGDTNVTFRLGEIEYLPVGDNIADIVISNCVINLSPNKGQVFAEIFRVLKPGGRVAICDVVLRNELPLASDAQTQLEMKAVTLPEHLQTATALAC